MGLLGTLPLKNTWIVDCTLQVLATILALEALRAEVHDAVVKVLATQVTSMLVPLARLDLERPGLDVC